MPALAGLAILAALLPFAPAPAADSFSRDHTIDLRDAYVAAHPASTRGRASVAARPSDPASPTGEFFWDPAAPQAQLCGPAVCIHYVTTTSDAPPLAATDGVTPDWVRRNLDVAERSLARMAELGYPAVPPDGGRGASAQFDVYLADVGTAGLYGYCSPEAPVPGAPGQASSFCVFDNDFTGFPMAPDESLRVTAAHELFHAVQFGMDVEEDRWFLESTATWIEEQVADDANDNRQFLRSGQLGQPLVPLDSAAGGVGIYGNWIFFQFLSQRYGDDAVRQVWRLASAHPGQRDLFSVKAVRQFVESRGNSFAQVYAAFALANLTPGRSYDEGATYPGGRPDAIRLATGTSPWRDAAIGVPHLSSQAVTFSPRRDSALRARLRLTVSASRPSGAAAVARVTTRSGRVSTLPIRLVDGSGSRVLNFARGRIRTVDVVLANGSTRFDCDRSTPFACGGIARDDHQRFTLVANAVTPRR